MAKAAAGGAGAAGGRPLRADARRNRVRVLDAAEAAFAAKGAAASTEEIARAAGVGVGTVFRHFPTKKDLLMAIMEARLERVCALADALVDEGDPATGFFTFFGWMVEQAAAKRTVMDLVDQEGIALERAEPTQALRRAVGALLDGARRAGTVRPDAALPEVLALLTGTCQAAMRAGWDARLRERTLTIIFDGLRPAGAR
ncbi:MAG TPA: TetR/AcrR family transcriptional regulator [Streptosporangiaceae bacterium]|nr:TetR/AcrR family transcriptional regulator [Streptosporangiaceae bacterium]